MQTYFFGENRPTLKQLKDTINKHNDYTDYVRVWFADGTSRIYYNTEPRVDYYCNKGYFITFESPELSVTGSFGRLGIIRSKRVIIKKKESE